MLLVPLHRRAQLFRHKAHRHHRSGNAVQHGHGGRNTVIQGHALSVDQSRGGADGENNGFIRRGDGGLQRVLVPFHVGPQGVADKADGHHGAGTVDKGRDVGLQELSVHLQGGRIDRNGLKLSRAGAHRQGGGRGGGRGRHRQQCHSRENQQQHGGKSFHVQTPFR